MAGACKEKQNCSIRTSPEALGFRDACPLVSKYAEVAHKCRPSKFYITKKERKKINFNFNKLKIATFLFSMKKTDTFRNKVICAGREVELTCPKSQRLLIYSASFGTLLQIPHECSLLSGSQSKSNADLTNVNTAKSGLSVCQAAKANDLVTNRCQGQKQCHLSATFDEFGWNECARTYPNIHQSPYLHLKVVYNCVPKEVLRDSLVAGRPVRLNLTVPSISSIRQPSIVASNVRNSIESNESKTSLIALKGFASSSSPTSSLNTTKVIAKEANVKRNNQTETTSLVLSTTTTTPANNYNELFELARYDLTETSKNGEDNDKDHGPDDNNDNEKKMMKEKKTQPETAANYKTHSLDHADEVKSNYEVVWSDWLSVYQHFERKTSIFYFIFYLYFLLIFIFIFFSKTKKEIQNDF